MVELRALLCIVCQQHVRRAAGVVLLIAWMSTAHGYTSNDRTVQIVEGNVSAAAPLGESFRSSFAMVLVTELGDKTFFIAALLAMRHDRLAVFAGAFGALCGMTLLSVGIGSALPTLLPHWCTHWAAVGLFFYFGARQLVDVVTMLRTGEGAGPGDELGEVEESLNKSTKRTANMCRAISMQAFSLTFLAEWGDRSQISTIALAAAKDPVGVSIGGIAGHFCASSVAVFGGRLLAAQISERFILGLGGSLFMAFAMQGALIGCTD
mmetsp:Transcript_25123/g.49196  ORF Transcript_25123/g.49196 Transcript_25123/m.49196 type:complete len:265 (-) Transcript_25123:103-897(-)